MCCLQKLHFKPIAKMYFQPSTSLKSCIDKLTNSPAIQSRTSICNRKNKHRMKSDEIKNSLICFSTTDGQFETSCNVNLLVAMLIY